MGWGQRLFLLRRAAASALALARLPVAPLAEIFPGIEELEVSHCHRVRPRGLPHGEAYVLALITAWASPARILEIGTGTGEGTLLLARQAPHARIETLDLGSEDASLGVQHADRPLERDPVGRAFQATAAAERITQHFGDSARFDFAPFRGSIDLALVDGAHTFDYALSDSRTALASVRPGGVIVWDDCHLYHPGVSRALLRLRREGLPVARIETTRLAALVKARDS
jgi:predicted O-methyltransferase YrrM